MDSHRKKVANALADKWTRVIEVQGVAAGIGPMPAGQLAVAYQELSCVVTRNTIKQHLWYTLEGDDAFHAVAAIALWALRGEDEFPPLLDNGDWEEIKELFKNATKSRFEY